MNIHKVCTKRVNKLINSQNIKKKQYLNNPMPCRVSDYSLLWIQTIYPIDTSLTFETLCIRLRYDLRPLLLLCLLYLPRQEYFNKFIFYLTFHSLGQKPIKKIPIISHITAFLLDIMKILQIPFLVMLWLCFDHYSIKAWNNTQNIAITWLEKAEIQNEVIRNPIPWNSCFHLLGKIISPCWDMKFVSASICWAKPQVNSYYLDYQRVL